MCVCEPGSCNPHCVYVGCMYASMLSQDHVTHTVYVGCMYVSMHVCLKPGSCNPHCVYVGCMYVSMHVCV